MELKVTMVPQILYTDLQPFVQKCLDLKPRHYSISYVNNYTNDSTYDVDTTKKSDEDAIKEVETYLKAMKAKEPFEYPELGTLLKYIRIKCNVAIPEKFKLFVCW